MADNKAKNTTAKSSGYEVLWLGKNDQYIVLVPTSIFDEELDNKEYDGFYRLALPQSYTLEVNKGDFVDLDESQFWVQTTKEGEKYGKIGNLASKREEESKARVKAKQANRDFDSMSVLELAEKFDAGKLDALLKYKVANQALTAKNYASQTDL